MVGRYACVRGRDSKDCGPAALATVAQHYGLRVSVGRLADEMRTDLQGTDFEQIRTAAERLGFTASVGRAKPGVLDSIPLPAIAHLADEPSGHYVVLHEVRPNQVVAADPAAGVVTVSREEFMRRWSGSLLLLAPSSELREDRSASSPFVRILRLALSERRLLVESVVCAGIVTVLGFCTSLFLKVLLDRIVPESNMSLLHLLALGMLAVLGFQAAFTFLRYYVLAFAGMRIELALGLAYLQHLFFLPLRFFDRRSTGEIYSRISDVGHVRQAITGALLSVLVDLLLLTAATAFLLVFDATLALVALAFFPLIGVVTYLVQRPLYRRQVESRRYSSEVAGRVLDTLSGIRAVKSCTAEEACLQRIEESLERLHECTFKAGLLSGALAAASALLTASVSVVILWAGTDQVLSGHATLGQLLFFFSILGFQLGPAERLANSLLTLQQAVVSIERLEDIHSLSREGSDSPRLLRPQRLEGRIELQDVNFSYRSDRLVLEEIGLTIAAGKTVAILGATGSGKSSLAGLLVGLYLPDSGRILFDGQDLVNYDIRSLRRRVGIVFQEPQIFGRTIFENIALDDPNTPMEVVHEAAIAAQAHDFIRALPNGYSHQVGNFGAGLSSGQRQRIAIARAILRDPDVLILDEATSHLDPVTERAVLEALSLRRRGRTTILITHRLGTAVRSDLIVLLAQGRIVDRGTHEELFERCREYRVMWESMTGGDDRRDSVPFSRFPCNPS